MLAACMPKSRAQKSEHLTSAHNGADSPEVRTHQRVRFDPFSNCGPAETRGAVLRESVEKKARHQVVPMCAATKLQN